MMLRISPLPDEIALAYKGRVLRDNGWSDLNEGMRWLMAWAGSGNATRREVSTVELMAKVAGMDTTTFVLGHTMVPLRRAVISKHPGIPHGSQEKGSLLWTIALRDIRPGAYFCVKCADEDFEHHGTPYWRRSHQLPGAYSCSKHGIALSYVETADALLLSPTAFKNSHQVLSERWVADLQKSAPIQRFLAISSDLLARDRPLDELSVSRAARARALSLGLHTGHGTVRKRLLSDLVKQLFNNDWLACVIPGAINRPAGKYWQPVDGAVAGKRAGLSSVVYALTFSALFESADDAINAMIATTSSDKCESPKRQNAKQIDNDQVRSAYVAANGSHRAAAAQLKLTYWSTTRRLNAFGLPPLGKLDAGRLRDTIQAVLMHDMSLSCACKKYELALADVQAALSDALGPLESALRQITGTRPRRMTAPKFRPVPPPKQKASTCSVPETSSPSIDAFGSKQRVAEPA